MTDTLLDKISKSSNSTIITDTWLTGQTGEIVDIKGDYVFRFIDFIIDNGELRHKHTTEESKLTCPIVATGLVGFWLHHKDDIGIKDIFEAYFKLRLEQYVSTHKYDDNAWERDLQKEFICQHHIPSEKNLIKESEALFAYITESDQNKLMSISSNYLKFARAKRKELYPPNHPANRIIEDTFLDAYRMGGPAYECVKWMRIEYNMPNMGPHWHKSGKTQKELLSDKWKIHHDSYIPEYVAEEYEDFDDGVIMYTDGELMDEINENLKSCSTYDDRVRYIISLLQPFKEFAAAFNSKEQTDERKRAIERCKNDMKSWENVAEDAVDELTGEPLEASKQIEACKSFIDRYEQDIKYWKTIEEDFFWLAQHGLGAGHYRTFKCEVNDKMCKYLGEWWSLMITFSRRLAAVVLTYGIKLMDIQEQCGTYLNWRFMITDYVDHKFVTSIDHARKLIADIESNKRKETVEKLFKSNEEFDAWNYISSLIRSAQKRIILVDAYIDERILSLLTKRKANVTATIYSRYKETIKTDVEKYNKQYSPIEYIQFPKAVHDRFLIIDDVVYHMGASVKDMGKSLCAVTKMNKTPQEIIDNVTT